MVCRLQTSNSPSPGQVKSWRQVDWHGSASGTQFGIFCLLSCKTDYPHHSPLTRNIFFWEESSIQLSLSWKKILQMERGDGLGTTAACIFQAHQGQESTARSNGHASSMAWASRSEHQFFFQVSQRHSSYSHFRNV